MKIVLRETIKKLGDIGALVEVKDGYARNFLIPKGFALEATEANLKRVAFEQREREKRAQREKEEAQKLATHISNISITVAAEAQDDDRLYGSITTSQIVEALRKDGIKLDKEKIKLETPIKKLGIYSIPILLYPEVRINLKLWVVRR